jgi:hypothetical protein
MSRKLNSLSTLFAMILLVVAASSAMAQTGATKRVSTVATGVTGNVSPAYKFNFVAPYSTPAFDATGIWQSNFGDQMQVFQEKDEVNAILVNTGWVHRLAGRYIDKTTVRMVLIRRTRSNGCEVTMHLDLKVLSATSLSGAAVASETGCGITQGQTFPETWTRIL